MRRASPRHTAHRVSSSMSSSFMLTFLQTHSLGTCDHRCSRTRGAARWRGPLRGDGHVKVLDRRPEFSGVSHLLRKARACAAVSGGASTGCSEATFGFCSAIGSRPNYGQCPPQAGSGQAPNSVSSTHATTTRPGACTVPRPSAAVLCQNLFTTRGQRQQRPPQQVTSQGFVYWAGPPVGLAPLAKRLVPEVS